MGATPMPDEGSTLNDLRRLHGTLLAEAWHDFLTRMDEDPESISLVEWSEAVTKFCGRMEVIENFQQVLNWFSASPYYQREVEFPDGQGGQIAEVVQIKNHPSLSPSFMEVFRQYASVDLKQQLVVELRDPILAASFMVQGKKLKQTQSNVRLSESLGMS